MTDVGDLDLEGALDLALAAADVVQKAAAGDGIDGLDQAETLLRLRQMQRLSWLLGTVQSELTRHAYQSGRRGHQLVEGLGRVRVYRTDSRTRWDERAAAQEVIDHKMATDHPDGEVPSPSEVLSWLLEAGTFSYFRTTVLRAWGIDPDDLSERVKGKPAVALPPLD
jgi:hypothetical protein